MRAFPIQKLHLSRNVIRRKVTKVLPMCTSHAMVSNEKDASRKFKCLLKFSERQHLMGAQVASIGRHLGEERATGSDDDLEMRTKEIKI